MSLNRFLKLALAGSLLVAGTASAQIYNLVSYKKHVSNVSSHQDPALYSAQYMVDANPTTRWASSFQDNQSFVIDLGWAQPIDKIAIKWEAAYAKNMIVQTSNTNTNDFVTKYSSTNFNGGDQIITQSLGTARYVKFILSNRSLPQYGMSIYELELFSLENHSTHQAIKLNSYSDWGGKPRPQCTASNVGLMIVEQNGHYSSDAILSVCLGYYNPTTSAYRWVQIAKGSP